GLFANLRPIKGFAPLLHASPLKESVINGSDILIVRELTGGLYFGKPSERREKGNAAVDTLYYHRYEIERIVERGFQSAQLRNKHLTSVDKANVLESSRMWREIVNEKSKDYPDVTVEHLLVDAAAMKLVTNPNSFDVMVTENLFGDILSDEASVLTGSLGMLPSASLRSDGVGLYEPVHGSAPDIAGKGIANPLAMILSAAMMLRHSFQMKEEADAIEQAVNRALDNGYHTIDLDIPNGKQVGTKEMTEIVIENLTNRSVENCNLSTYALIKERGHEMGKPKTIIQKIWENNVVHQEEGKPDLLYIDLHLVHEVTSPQAFEGLRMNNRQVRRPDLTYATMDHNVPTQNREVIKDKISRKQMETLQKNCEENDITLADMHHPDQGIVHVIGPELGLTQPGKTIVCGDSHTSTHGAF